MPLNKFQVPILWDQFDGDKYLDFCPSVAYHLDDYVVAFRRNQSPPEWGKGEIWIVIVNEDLIPISIPYKIVESGEDPRLIVLDNRLFLFYVQVEFNSDNNLTGSHINLGELKRSGDYFLSKNTSLPKNPIGEQNRPKESFVNFEKNWVPFLINKKNSLGILYSHNPWTVLEIFLPENQSEWKFINFFTQEGISWSHGEIRGGTVPISYSDDEYLTIFHSSCISGDKKIYYSGACLFSKYPPFTPQSITPTPILTSPHKLGSDFYGWEKGQPIIFPLGLAKHNNSNDFALLCSVNDAFIGKFTLPDKYLKTNLKLIANIDQKNIVKFPKKNNPSEYFFFILDQTETIDVHRILRFYFDLNLMGTTYFDIGNELGYSFITLSQFFSKNISISSDQAVEQKRNQNFLINQIEKHIVLNFNNTTDLIKYLDNLIDNDSLVRLDFIYPFETCLNLFGYLLSKNIRFIVRHFNLEFKDHLQNVKHSSDIYLKSVCFGEEQIDFIFPDRFHLDIEWYLG